MERIINYKKILVTNLPLLITLPSEGVERYNSCVHDIDERFFDISYPTAGGAPILVHNDEALRMTIAGCGGYYVFTSKVIERFGSRNPMLKMTLPAYIEKCERREFFRLDIMKKIKIYGAKLSVKGDEVDVLPENLIGECLCVEIGGGGARLICNNPLPEGTVIGLDVSTIIKNFNIIKCVIVRSSIRNDKMTDIGLKFVQLRSAERDAIVKSCYSKQIERRYMMPSCKRIF